MKSTGGIMRATMILFAILAGGLGLLRVTGVMEQAAFLEWLWRSAAAVAIVGGVGIAIHALQGGDSKA